MEEKMELMLFIWLYASVKNEGKSMGLLIEQYVGRTGRRLFLLFSWLFISGYINRQMTINAPMDSVQIRSAFQACFNS